ncbi:uncharacterized protein LOC135090497 isoform X1 [Scylla paramamosain]|uniref:uncharacterized protein LOC135090497 isoform X1 n=1 Tax=Scylla paramamosain TaxID=85552 RepID=UPI003083AEF7
MLCSESEKLCPSCKVIVPSAVFADHFKECLQKFKRTRGGCKKKLPDANREGETNQQKEHQPVLPCPVCKKPFKSKTQRVSHVKACAHGHGLTSEQLLLASRLLEKQTEEWSELGLPSVQQPQNSKPKAQKAVKHTEDLNDPDIAMALAMSRSMVEEEVESRTSREEKLFALGMEDIVNEDRKVKPVLLLPPDAVSSKTSARQMKKTAKNRKGCCRIYNTALVTRSVEERERLISEKVAVLLTSSDTAEGGWANSETPKHSRRLASLVNKTCQLWEAARSGTDEPIHSFYVPDLEPYIIPKETVIGSLFRHLSQVPGRVNTTALHAMDEESESECETETTSEVEDFCTQMVLAELMGSQEEQDHSSETEWEQTSEVMDTQGFLLPSQIAKTQRESKVNTSLLGSDPGLQFRELNGNNTVNNERAVKENFTYNSQIHNCKENTTELKESSNLKNKGDKSPLLEGFLHVYEENYENIGTHSSKKQDDFDHNTDPDVHDDDSDNRCESGDSISETIRSSQNNKREAICQEKDTFQNVQILFESTKHTEAISEDETLNHNTSATAKESMLVLPHLRASCKTNNKKHHAENVGFKLDIDSRGQSQKHESNIDIAFNVVGCNDSLGLHSLCSIPSPNSSSCKKYDSNKKQLEDSPLHSLQYDKDPYTTPKKACEYKKAGLEVSCMGSSKFHGNNSMLQSSGKDYSKTNKQLEHEIANSAFKEKTLIKDNFANNKSDFMIDTLIQNWKDILQSGTESDVTIITSDGSSLTAHSIVLLARCSQLYKESKACGNFIKWDNIPQKTARHFLSYLYTGICEVTTPGDPLWIELYDVALRYNCSDLVSYMELIYKAKRSPVKTPYASFQRNCFVNSDLNVIPSVRKVNKCITPSLKIPVVNLEEDLELINGPSDSMSDSAKKFMMDGKTLKPTRLFSEKTQRELDYKTSPENRVSEFDLTVNHKEPQGESECQEKDEGTESPDLFESFCSRSCTTSPLSCPTVTGIPQHSSHGNLVHSIPKEQRNICQELPKTSSSYKLPLLVERKEGKKTGSIKDITGHEQDILATISNSLLPTLPDRYEENDCDDNSDDLRQSDSEARITDLLFSDCRTENVYKDSVKKVDCIDDENKKSPIGETVDIHECYISNIWDDFDAGGSPVMVFEEDSTFSSPIPKVCDKIKSDDKLESCATPIAQSSSHHAASTPLLHDKDFLQRDICSSTLQSSKLEESEGSKLENKCTVSAKFDSIEFTKGQPSDETLVNIAAEVEQLDDNIHQTVNEAESKPVTPVKTCCTPATHQIYFSKRKEVTPQPDYKNMKSPDLKKELQKYGICALGRKKAVMVLQHVYEQTHPFVTDSEAETSFSQTPQKNAVIPTDRPKLLQSQMRKKGRFGLASVELKSNKKNATREVAPEESALPVEGEREKEESEESQLNSSTSSEGSSGYLFGETVFSPEEEDNLSSTQQADLASQVREMIVSNSDLHRKVLLYEPIFVEDLHAILKSNKTKCSIQALLDVLDDLCLIVRTQANQNRCQIRASKTRKKTSPKKKT